MGSINRFDLGEVIKKFDIKYFVETGTLYGDGVDYALKYSFDRIFSIEIEDILFNKAVEKYRNVPSVNIIKGDSSKILSNIVEQLDGNTIFWLDAHFPGADSNIRTYKECLNYKYNTRLPLESELKIISNRRKVFKDVLICDDLWIYKEGIFGAGTVDDHSKRHNHNITRKEIVEENNINFVYDEFSSTHTFKEVYDDQGYLVILPKHESSSIDTAK